jgi:hypothetical protein
MLTESGQGHILARNLLGRLLQARLAPSTHRPNLPELTAACPRSRRRSSASSASSAGDYAATFRSEVLKDAPASRTLSTNGIASRLLTVDDRRHCQTRSKNKLVLHRKMWQYSRMPASYFNQLANHERDTVQMLALMDSIRQASERPYSAPAERFYNSRGEPSFTYVYKLHLPMLPDAPTVAISSGISDGRQFVGQQPHHTSSISVLGVS